MSGFTASTLRAKHAQGLQARDRRQHAHRVPLQQPGGVAVDAEVLRLGNRNGRLVRHQQMERQPGERARRHEQEMALVLDERLDRAEQRRVQLVRKVEVEQLRAAGIDRELQVVHVEAAAERRHLGAQVLLADRDHLPGDAVRRQRENVGLTLARKPEDERLVGREQLLYRLALQRLRRGERGVFGKLVLQLGGQPRSAVRRNTAISLRIASSEPWPVLP